MELTLDQALQKGIEAHKAGKVQEADRYYTAILEANPKHPDANHNMGVLAVGIGKVEEALPFFKAALDINSSIEQFWLSYIDALVKLERSTDARAVLTEAKEKGFSGAGFDKLDQGLKTSSDSSETDPKPQEPPQEKVQDLINLWTRGEFQKALKGASKLLSDFSERGIITSDINASNTLEKTVVITKTSAK